MPYYVLSCMGVDALLMFYVLFCAKQIPSGAIKEFIYPHEVFKVLRGMEI